MGGLRATTPTVLILILALAGCGGANDADRQADEPSAPASEPTGAGAGEASGGKASEEESTAPAATSAKANRARRPAGEEGLRVPAKRARIVAKESQHGTVLFDANGQVVYLFENDRRNRSNCTSDDCVEAWPPVLTRQPPSAGVGVDARLLGTIRRGGGGLQVTYDGRPLYFYEHEQPGEIKCHNVELNGGLWWVVTPRGDPAA